MSRTRSALLATLALLAPATGETQGTFIWAERYPKTPGETMFAEGLTIGARGHIFVLATVGPVNGDRDFLTLKYTSDGFLIWDQRFGGPGEEVAVGIATDNLENVYVTGYASADSASIGEGYGIVTVKYDSSGVEQWVRRYDGPGGAEDAPCGIVVDDAQNIYVGGTTFVGQTTPLIDDDDFMLLKYDSSGDTVWTRTFDGFEHRSDGARDIALDPVGNVVLAGISNRNTTRHDFMTVRFSPAGDLRWFAEVALPYRDVPQALAVGGNGNVCVTGDVGDDSEGADFYTVCYDSSGTELWADQLDDRNGPDAVRDIVVDASGNVAVTGNFAAPLTDPDFAHEFATVQYDPAGNRNWIHRFAGPAVSLNSGVALVVGLEDHLYATGSVEGIGTGREIATLSYTDLGDTAWVRLYEQPRIDVGQFIAADRRGNVFVLGNSQNATSNDLVLLRYWEDFPTPTRAMMFTGRAIVEGVVLAWRVHRPDMYTSFIVRRGYSADAELAALVSADSPTVGSEYRALDAHAPEGATSAYELLGRTRQGEDQVLASTSVFVPIRTPAIELATPNPTRGSVRLTLRFAEGEAGSPYRLDLVDVAGRRVGELSSGTAGRDPLEIQWPSDGASDPLAPGLYFLRLRTAFREQVLRIAVVR